MGLPAPYYQRTTSASGHSRYFAFELGSIGVCDPREYNDSNYAARLLNRQADFISTLAGLQGSASVELRFKSEPNPTMPQRGKVHILLRIRVDGDDATEVTARTRAALDGLYPNLAAISNIYHWKPIERAADYRAAFHPEAKLNIVELVRREARISLCRIPATTPDQPIGFQANPINPESSSIQAKDAYAHVVYPFQRTFNTLQRLFTTLLSHPYPITISVLLKPTNLEPEEKNYLQEQLQQCERFLNLPSSGQYNPPEQFFPTLERNTRIALNTLEHMAFTLQDDHVQMNVFIASRHPLPPMICDALGIAVTEHVCSRDTHSDAGSGHDHMSGGYDWIIPADQTHADTLLHAMDHIEFPVADGASFAPHGRRLRYLADPRQANAVFRLPIPLPATFPGVTTRRARYVAPPVELPSEGDCRIGTSPHGGLPQPIWLQQDDRRRHMYVVGQTGTGKSSLLLNMILQDIRNGHGTCVIDPHGELVRQVLCRIPPEREEDVIYVDPTDPEAAIGLNLLQCHTELERDKAVNQLLEIFNTLYNMREAGGPIFELYLRNAAMLTMSDPDSGSTFIELLRVFTDKDFRELKLNACNDPLIVDFWKNIAEKIHGELNFEAMAAYVMSKFSRFLYNSIMRPIIAQQTSTIDFRTAMDKGKIILIDLNKGRLGETNAHFLGMIIVSLLERAALSRTDQPLQELRDFRLYVDEFQNLATPDFTTLLSEARKFRLNLILTNQYLHQIPEEIRHAVTGNVGTIFSFRLGQVDAELLEKEFSPDICQGDLMNLPNFQGYVSTLFSGEAAAPFSVATELDTTVTDSAVAERIMIQSRTHYARPRDEIQNEIESRMRHLTNSE